MAWKPWYSLAFCESSDCHIIKFYTYFPGIISKHFNHQWGRCMPDQLARQLDILNIIPKTGSIETATIFHRLETMGYNISKKTVERDLEFLKKTSALKIEGKRKPYKWSFSRPDAMKKSPLISDADSVYLLLINKNLKNLLPICSNNDFEANIKLAEDIINNNTRNRSLKEWLNTVRIIPAGQPLLPPEIDQTIQRTVYEALQNDQQLDIYYQPVGKNIRCFENVNPLSLVQQGEVIYLIATVCEYKKPIILCIHRIKSAKLLFSAVIKPENFSVDEFITQGGMGYSEANQWIDFVAVFKPSSGQHLLETRLSRDQKVMTLPGGEIQISAKIPYTKQLVWWLTSFGANVKVLAPQALRHEIKQHHQDALAALEAE